MHGLSSKSLSNYQAEPAMLDCWQFGKLASLFVDGKHDYVKYV
jgi:hypothetical protein